jgi:hypothetical protein
VGSFVKDAIWGGRFSGERGAVLLPEIKRSVILPEMLDYEWYSLSVIEVSGAGELPPCALSELDVTVSRHPAPIVQP